METTSHDVQFQERVEESQDISPVCCQKSRYTLKSGRSALWLKFTEYCFEKAVIKTTLQI